jgi:transcriptional regulator with XRE-family HTH domain
MVPHELKIERTRLAIPQYRLAAALGITQSALCAMENGRRPVSPDQERAVRNALHRLATNRRVPEREIDDAVAVA